MWQDMCIFQPTFSGQGMENLVKFLCLTAYLLLLAVTAAAQSATPINDAPMSPEQFAAKKITPPELVYGETAEYPVDARSQDLDGLCSITLVVGVQGDPQNVRIIHCTDPSFEETSLNAAKQDKFKPAIAQDGNPVAVLVCAIYQYHLSKYWLSLRMIVNWPVVPDKRLLLDRRMGKTGVNREMSVPIHYGFIPQQGGASIPDSEGVYPLARSVTGPRVIKFSDEGYGRLAFTHDGSSACDILLTISTKGKASEPQITHCDRPELEGPVVDSLLKSDYRPGLVRGKEVSMRASLHLDYGEEEGMSSISSR